MTALQVLQGRRRRRAAVREHADDGGVLPPLTGVVINCCKCVVGINGFPTAYHPALAQKEIVVVEIDRVGSPVGRLLVDGTRRRQH